MSCSPPCASFCLSVSLFFSLCTQPATGMYLEERLARRTGSNKFKAALEPGCLSLSPSFYLFSFSPTPLCPAPCFPSVPPPLQVSLFSSLLFLQTLLPFAALFLLFYPPFSFSLVFLLNSSGTRETQRDLLNAFACRSWTSVEGIMWICSACVCVCVNFHIFQPFSPQLHRW